MRTSKQPFKKLKESGLLCIYKVCDYEIDIWDKERIPVQDKMSKYFLTPNRLAKIENWIISEFKLDKISKKEDIEYLIQENMIGTY